MRPGPVELSARLLAAGRPDANALAISDGMELVLIGHEDGDDAEEVATRFDELARAAAAHAERIRAEARRVAAWT